MVEAVGVGVAVGIEVAVEVLHHVIEDGKIRVRDIVIAKEEEEVTAAADLAVDHGVLLIGTGIEETGIEETETGIVIGIVDVAAEGAEARVDVPLVTVEVEAGV